MPTTDGSRKNVTRGLVRRSYPITHSLMATGVISHHFIFAEVTKARTLKSVSILMTGVEVRGPGMADHLARSAVNTPF